MRHEKKRSAMRRFGGGVVAVATLVVAFMGASEPAAAHTRAEAIRYACGSRYELVDSDPLVGSSGRAVGSVILAREPGTDRFCAVTNKLASHGVNTHTYVSIADSGDALGDTDEGDYAHFANVVPFIHEEGTIEVWGRFKTTNGVWASEPARLYYSHS